MSLTNCACIVGLALLWGYEPGEKEVEAHKCEVWLDGSVDKVRGITWPKDEGIWEDTAAFQSPLDVTLHLPSGRRVTIYSRVSFIGQVGGIVSRVQLTPLKEPATFQAAVAALANIGKLLGIAKQEDFASKIATWRNEDPAFDSFESRPLKCRVEKGVEVFAEIEPLYYDEGWMLNVEWYAMRLYPD